LPPESRHDAIVFQLIHNYHWLGWALLYRPDPGFQTRPRLRFGMLPLPISENAWIADVLGALRRRSRALRRKVHSLECERVFEEIDGARSERIDLALRGARSRGPVFRAKLWADRWTWVDAREAGKSGWTIEWTFQGRAAGGLAGREFIAAIEETLFVMSLPAMPTAKARSAKSGDPFFWLGRRRFDPSEGRCSKRV
jgi:hypothetical protein